jgi:phosphonate transport system substrate-binding protein
MSDVTPTIRPSVDRSGVKGWFGVWGRIILFCCLIGAVVYVSVAAMQMVRQNDSLRQTQDRSVASAGLTGLHPKTLAGKFTDTGGRLLADPPSDANQMINPDVLVVAHIAGADEVPGNSWAEWEGRLAKITGKKVVDQTYDNSAEQIAAAASGKVTLLALHAADTPFLVNNYGFEPVAVLGDEAGINGNRLDLIVSSASRVSRPAELMGQRLVCTVPSSITGYRAAIAMLMRDNGLRPNVDYEIIWSLGQKASITGVADKEYDVAAVSDEKLQSLVEKGTINASQFKIIYQSPVIPRTTIGYFYNLNPALADKLRQAILAGGAESDPGVLSFMPVDYKRDFEFVRNIDDQFDPRFDAQSQKTLHSD